MRTEEKVVEHRQIELSLDDVKAVTSFAKAQGAKRGPMAYSGAYEGMTNGVTKERLRVLSLLQEGEMAFREQIRTGNTIVPKSELGAIADTLRVMRVLIERGSGF